MAQSNYAARMARLSARIFSEIARPESAKSKKLVKLLSNPYYHEKSEHVYYYPKHFEITDLMMTTRYHGLFRSEHWDFKEEMERLRQLRGKGKPARDARKKNRRKDKENN